MEIYKKSVSREGSLIGFQAWIEGDETDLENCLGSSFKKHYFVNNEGLITLFYEEKEGDDFYKKLSEEILKEGFLDPLITNFISYVKKGRELFEREASKQKIIDLYQLTIQCWPAVTIFDELSKSQELLEKNIGVLDKLLKVRKEYGEFMYEVEKVISDSIIKIYPQIDGFQNFITIEEFTNGKFPEKEELEKRKKYYVLNKYNLEINKSFSEIAEEYNFKIEEKNSGKTEKEVKGMIAMRGKAIGRVKILYKTEDINKIEAGDILIAPMTTPDHIIAMDKASAFVTDEGGIACHAAIIAREFGKPCIVGTDNATKVFKDNDLVFVNADEGTVKIFKSSLL